MSEVPLYRAVPSWYESRDLRYPNGESRVVTFDPLGDTLHPTPKSPHPTP